MNITPTYVTIEKYQSYCNLELLKLLFKKGFRFKLDIEGHRVTNNLAEQRFNEGDINYCKDYVPYSVVIEWLRVNHGIWINIQIPAWSSKGFKYAWEIIILKNYEIIKFPNTLYSRYSSPEERLEEGFNSPHEAYSAAFDYILKELI